MKPILERILDEYPYFMDRREGSVHRRYHETTSLALNHVRQQTKILKMLNWLPRPIKIWRSQITEGEYVIHSKVNLPLLKRVKLYKEGNKYDSSPPELLHDSGILERGTEEYELEEVFKVNKNILTEGDSVVLQSSPTNFALSTFPGGVTSVKNLIKESLPEGAEAGVSFEVTDTNEPGGYAYTTNPVRAYPHAGEKLYVYQWGKCETSNPSIMAGTRIRFFDNDSVAQYPFVESGYLPVPQGEWFLMKAEGVMPSGATRFNVAMDFQGTPQIGDKYYISKLMVSLNPVDYWVKGGEEIIPTTKYFVVVEDYDEGFFVKGFPENDSPKANKYDHDNALDMIGGRYGVPRLNFRDVQPYDYVKTHPPYNYDKTEWDVCYETRLKEYMEEYERLPLPVTEIKKIYHIMPLLEGRWRHICRMNKHLMGEKYMATKEWNSCVFDVSANIDLVPKNIIMPTGDSVQELMERAMPLSKKAYITLSTAESFGGYFADIVDTYRFRTEEDAGDIDLVERVNMALIGGIYDESHKLDFVERYILNVPSSLERYMLTEEIKASWFKNYLFVDTDTEFNAGVKTGVKTVGSGTAAYINLDISSANGGYKLGGAVSTEGTGNNWGDTSNVLVKNTAYTYSFYYGGDSRWLRIRTFGQEVPSNATIRGITMQWNRNGWGTNNGALIRCYFRYPDNPIYKEKTGTLPASSMVTGTIGGSTDLWGWNVGDITPSDVNNGLEIWIKALNVSNGNSAQIAWVEVMIHWEIREGTYTTVLSSIPAVGESFHQMTTQQTVPSECGSSALVYDVLRQNGAILKSNATPPIDLSDVASQRIRVIAKMKTANVNFSPSIDWIKIDSKNDYSIE